MGFMLLLRDGRIVLPDSDRSALWILVVAAAAIAGVFLLDPIPQDPAYHAFADTRKMAGVANAWNVLSNLPFLVAGAFGFLTLPRLASPLLRTHYLVFCAGITLVAAGSAYYHFEPSIRALVWDRLPMTVAFMALLSAVVADRFSWLIGRALLGPLIALGVASIAWWLRTELAGAGDLRLYGAVQFLPMLLIPMMLVLRNGQWIRARWLWAALGAYAAAKLAEHFDAAIFSGLGWISGHGLKHLLAALSCWWVILALQKGTKGDAPL